MQYQEYDEYYKIFEEDVYLKKNYVVEVDEKLKTEFFKMAITENPRFYQGYPDEYKLEFENGKINETTFEDDDERFGYDWGNGMISFYQFFIYFDDKIMVASTTENKFNKDLGEYPYVYDCRGNKCRNDGEYCTKNVWCEACAGESPKIKFYVDGPYFNDLLNKFVFFEDFHVICIKKEFYSDHKSRYHYSRNKINQ